MIEKFSALVHTIYEGSTDRAAWPRIVGAVADQLGAEKGMLLTPFVTGGGGFTFVHAISPVEIEHWVERCRTEGACARRWAETGLTREGVVALGDELISDIDLHDSTWHREFAARFDTVRMIVAIVFGADNTEAPATCIAFFRGIEGKPFDEKHRALLRQLVPHLSRALGTMFKLRDVGSRWTASLHALTQIRHGVLLLDECGRVQFANAAAERILNRQDGLRLVRDSSSAPKLTADRVINGLTLEQMLRTIFLERMSNGSHFNHTILIRRTTTNAYYALQFSYAAESRSTDFDAAQPRAVVFIKDEESALGFDVELLKDIYDLTQSEARAAKALCGGSRLETVAAQLNITLNTLKTHIKSIYAKTSVDNRAALTKLLLSLA